MDKGERWITIGGQHILLKEGETPMNAYIKYVAMKKQKKGYANKDFIKKKEDIKEESKTSEIKPNKFGIDDPYILFGEKHGTGTVTREQMVDYFIKKGEKTDDEKMIKNAEKLADDYLKYRKKIGR